MIFLRLPLQYTYITQYFGVNPQYYSQIKDACGKPLLGHNGIDFRCSMGTPIYASHSGNIIICGEDTSGGYEVRIHDDSKKFLTLYYHLSEFKVKLGDHVKAGQLIALSGGQPGTPGAGKFTTGPHLHTAPKDTDEAGNSLNLCNGYAGAYNQATFYSMNYQGYSFKNKDWDKANAYHRYFRTDRNYINELKVAVALTKYFKRLPNPEEINACVYGGWDRETVKDETKHDFWGYINKTEYQNGIRAF